MSNRQPIGTHDAYGLKGAFDTGRERREVTRSHDHDNHDPDSSNDHLASVYESQEDQFETVVPFVRRGLERGERCLYVADDNTRDEVVETLREGGIDVDDALRSGALSIHTKAETYLRTGEFEPDAMVNFWRETLAEARDEEGYAGVRAAAEMTWALEEGTDLDRLARYEAMLNTVYRGDDYVVLCQYNRERFPDDVLSDVIRSHPLLTYDGTACRNAQYLPPDEFFETDTPPLDADRTVEQLVGRARTQHALRECERYQRELYEITSSPDLSFDEKLEKLFDLGCEYFDLELGGIAHVDPTTDLFEVEAMSGDHEHLVPGARVALSETYCRLVSDRDEPAVGVSDPLDSGFEGTKAYEEFGVNAYIGTYIELDGALDRTLFFVSSESRDRPFSRAERTFHHLMGLWVEYELKKDRREDHLAALNALSREVMRAETKPAVSETVIEAAETSLGLPAAAIALYDEEKGTLQPVAATGLATEVLESLSLLDRGAGVGWNAFVESEPRRVPAPLEEADATVRPPVSEIGVFPLSDHGVFIAGSTASDGFGSSTYDVVETAAANAEAALDRAHREQRLHDREETLKEQNETLERLNRVNDVIRGIDQVLVRASTREEAIQAVCDRLVSAEAYRFAWIGVSDAVTDKVTPEAVAGVEDGYLETVTAIGDGSDDGYGPTGEAVRTQETQVQNELASDPPFEPWRQAALDRGYQAGIAVPLTYQETSYGVLTLYAGQPDVFDQMEETVLAELGETIGYALNALERKRALVSDRSLELEFRLRKGTPPLFRFAAELDCELTFENVVQRTGGSPGVLFTLHEASPKEVTAIGKRLPDVKEVTVVSERDDEALFEVELRDSAFFRALLERGAMPRTLTATGEEGYAEIRIPRTSDVRTLVELFETQWENVELVGRREVDEPVKTRQEFETEFRNQLTERQEEILETAYVSGFFEWPREMTAQDLAEALDVSQPTVSRHVRAGERTLFDLVFDGE